MPRSRPAAAARTAAFTALLSAGRSVQQVRSTSEPSGTGTFTAIPSRRPASAGSTSWIMAAALVAAGMMFSAAARPGLEVPGHLPPAAIARRRLDDHVDAEGSPRHVARFAPGEDPGLAPPAMEDAVADPRLLGETAEDRVVTQQVFEGGRLGD